jgi:hypothetical protein
VVVALNINPSCTHMVSSPDLCIEGHTLHTFEHGSSLNTMSLFEQSSPADGQVLNDVEPAGIERFSEQHHEAVELLRVGVPPVVNDNIEPTARLLHPAVERRYVTLVPNNDV